MTDTIADYWPMYWEQPAHGYVIVEQYGTVYTEWTASPGHIQWSPDDIEHFSTRVLGGVKYGYCDGFENPIEHTFPPMQSVIDRVTVNGITIDLAHYGEWGICFLPYNLPDTGEVVIEQWFKIYSDDKTVWRPAYYKAKFVCGQDVSNPHWQGPTPTIRRCVAQYEAWWDDGGWSRGSAAVPAWINRVPHEVGVVTYDQVTYIAKGAGVLWRGKDAGYDLYLRNVTGGKTTGGPIANNSAGAWSLGPNGETMLTTHVDNGWGTAYVQRSDTVYVLGKDNPPNWYRWDGKWVKTGSNLP